MSCVTSSCSGGWQLDRVIAVPGPPGPPGPPVDVSQLDLSGLVVSAGAEWFFGDGAPGVVAGAKPGDVYMDVVSGTVYKLEK